MVGRHEPAATSDPWIGRTLAGKYRLDARLGEGGFGTAYLAADLNYAAVTGAERRVVVKVPHMGRGGDDTAMPKDFRKEARALTRLEHAHIVKVHDVGIETVQHMGQDREVPFLVLQYAAGKSLADRLAESGRQSITEVLEWLPDIAKALDYLHAQHPPVLHRDVKPGNILFDAADSALLADFGIAKFFGTTSATGGLPGSPLYMAPDPMLVPEQVGAQALDARYDQYALAVTVYEALSGRFPHEPTAWANGRTSSLDEHSASRLVYRKTTEAPTPLAARAPQIASPLSAVVARALSTKREQRFALCREFAAAFADAAKLGSASTRASSTVPPPPPPPTASPPRRKARPRWPWVAGTTAVAGIAALLALRDRPNGEQRDPVPPSPLPTILALDAPLEGAFVSGDKVVVSGQASGPTDAVLTVNGTPVPVKDARFSTAVGDLTDGALSIRVEYGLPAERAARAETRHLVVDRTPPMLRITSPIDTSLAADATTVTIRGRIVDDHAASVIIGDATIPVTSKDGTFVVPDVALPTGATPSLRVFALDQGGLRSEALNLSFERAPTPPPAMAETPAPTPTPAPAAPPTPAPSVPPAVPPVEPPWKKFLAGWAEPVGSELDPVTGYPRRVKRTKDGMEMVLIPAGTFEMGAVPGDTSASSDESPRHEVTISKAYYLDVNEVTVGAWRKFVEGGGRRMPSDLRSEAKDSFPIHNVDHTEATAYAAWAGAALPTEAQWERAAKGGHDNFVYPWGVSDDAKKRNGVENDDGFPGLAPVRSFAPNDYGLYDMAGNVMEWCADWYGPDFYAKSPSRDPSGPGSGSSRVVRGGSFVIYGGVYLRASVRLGGAPSARSVILGFRLARSLD